nr:T9SS type A sorting domain-containing protein [Bacteroidota bacterium]
MKKIKYITAILIPIILYGSIYSQTLTNVGRNMVIMPNTVLVINGDYYNMSDGNITSDGLIYITGHWTNNASSGNLMEGSTGTVVFNGSGFQSIGGSSPTWFPGLQITQGPGLVELDNDITCSGFLEVNGREFSLTDNILHAQSHIGITSSGTLVAHPGSVIWMDDGNVFSVFSGGTATFVGSVSEPTMIRTLQGYYDFKIYSGGNIRAISTIFQNMGNQGLEIYGNVDPVISFDYCTFRNGKPGGTLITFDNPDPVSVYKAHFPPNTWGGSSNVTKLNDEWKITFNEAWDNFAGEPFENDPNNQVDWINTQLIHEIELEEGWSGLSTCLIPQNADPEIIFEPIINSLIYAFNFDGIFYPALNINTLQFWHNHDALIVKMADTALFPIMGTPDTNLMMQLNQGWTMMPVLTACPVNCDELFSPLGNTLEVVKEIAGTKLFWPDMGIYSLDELHPGKGYMVRCSDPIPVLFPNINCDGYDDPGSNSGVIILHPWNEVVVTGFSHTIGFNVESEDELTEGAIIGAFTSNGLCAGVTEITDNNQPFAITAFGDDPLTPEQDGFLEGEAISYRLFKSDQQTESSISVTYSQYHNEGQFTPNGISVVSGLYIGSSGQFEIEYGNTIQVYPNPNNGIFTISGLESTTQIRILNTKGQEVYARDVGQNTGEIQIDLKRLNRGVYIVNIHTNTGLVNRKLILK